MNHAGTQCEQIKQWDGAYVLGALSPAERTIFEEHLASCESCRAQVADLAGMPGILATVSKDVATSLTDDPITQAQAPPLVPLLARVRRSRIRRRVIAVAAGAAAAIALFVAFGSTLFAGGPQEVSVNLAAPDVTMSAHTTMRSAGEGTTVNTDCDYPAGAGYSSSASTYALYVIDNAGEAELVSTWAAAPGESIQSSGYTETPLSGIEAVEIRYADSTDALIWAEVP